jgi:hypothetical protein
MSRERLVCAHCAGPVDEGRCPVCRQARAQMHSHATGFASLSPALLAALLVALVAALVAALLMTAARAVA